MHVEKLIQIIQTYAPPQAAASWDCSGLQCISKNKNIKKMAVCLDATPQIVKQAEQKGIDFILAHHPLSLKPRMLNREDKYFNIISSLIKHNIWLYSAHTSLDANPRGPVNFLAKFFDLTDLSILDPYNENISSYGFGLSGNLPSVTSCRDLLNALGEFLNLQAVVLCGPSQFDKPVHRLGYCPGSGASLIPHAEEDNCDVFISGDIKYHDASASLIPIFDVGHFNMEEKMMELFANELSQVIPDLDIIFIHSKSPIQIFVLKTQEKFHE